VGIRKVGKAGARQWRDGSLIHGDNPAMKFASYSDGSRDGQLVVVSRDLSQAHYATHVANRLQQVLDDWNFLSPQLQDVYDELNAGRARHAFAFDPARCLAPLPRTYNHVQALAYPSHLQLLARSAAAGSAPAQAAAPALPCSSVRATTVGAAGTLALASGAVDFSVVGVIAADIPAGFPERALDGVRLLVLSQGWCCAVWPPVTPECAGQQAHPGAAFAPVAVTPDELGESWVRGRLQLGVTTWWNGRKVGMADLGSDMPWHFGTILSQLATTRSVRAGTLVCAGPVSNQGVEKKGRMEWPRGYHSIAEKRAMEVLLDGQAATDYLRFGDVVRSEVKRPDGSSVFGAVELELVALQRKAQTQSAASTGGDADTASD
jgi:fumarylacetoacetate (FAA) hydrolase